MNVSTEQLFTDSPHPEWLPARARAGPDPAPLYDLLKWGPTSANCSPARFVFVSSAPARRTKLLACVARATRQGAQAPVTVIIGMDLAFYEHAAAAVPAHRRARLVRGQARAIASTAFRNSSLQGGYLIMAARALGLGCGPMSGFDAEKMDAAFWAGTAVKTNFICTLGRGDPASSCAQPPRLSFA
jgi:3-hydroxypropanoate dehydrogenase